MDDGGKNSIALDRETVRTAATVLCLYAVDHPELMLGAEAWAAAGAMFLALGEAARADAARRERIESSPLDGVPLSSA